MSHASEKIPYLAVDFTQIGCIIGISAQLTQPMLVKYPCFVVLAADTFETDGCDSSTTTVDSRTQTPLMHRHDTVLEGNNEA